MHLQRILFIIFFLFSFFHLLAQQPMVKKGYVLIRQDTAIAQLMRRNTMYNETRTGIPGYRIQIYFGTDRAKAVEIRTEFLKQQAESEAYLIYHQPNFKVRVGDYKTRLEALKAIRVINLLYPGAFIVKDEIPLPKLN